MLSSLGTPLVSSGKHGIWFWRYLSNVCPSLDFFVGEVGHHWQEPHSHGFICRIPALVFPHCVVYFSRPKLNSQARALARPVHVHFENIRRWGGTSGSGWVPGLEFRFQLQCISRVLAAEKHLCRSQYIHNQATAAPSDEMYLKADLRWAKMPNWKRKLNIFLPFFDLDQQETRFLCLEAIRVRFLLSWRSVDVQIRHNNSTNEKGRSSGLFAIVTGSMTPFLSFCSGSYPFLLSHDVVGERLTQKQTSERNHYFSKLIFNCPGNLQHSRAGWCNKNSILYLMSLIPEHLQPKEVIALLMALSLV